MRYSSRLQRVPSILFYGPERMRQFDRHKPFAVEIGGNSKQVRQLFRHRPLLRDLPNVELRI